MAESSDLARDILSTPSEEGLSIIIGHLFMRQETDDYKSARIIYDFYVANFENCLTQKLLELYQSSSDGVLRFRSIYLLSKTLAEFRERNFHFSLDNLYEIKPLVISCLTLDETKESDIKILRRIVSFVAYNVAMLDNGGWDELSDCIILLANTEPLKGFHVFIDLPLVYGKFIDRFMQKLLEIAEKVLFNPEQGRSKDWSLALETVAKIGVQLPDEETRSNLIKVGLKSANELVEKGMKVFLERGLEDLEKFLARDANLYKYSKDQRVFAARLAFQIAASYKTIEQSKKVSRKILGVFKIQETYSNYDHESGFDRHWCDHLRNLSSLEILRIFASTDLEDRSREIAIRQVNVLLSDHTSKKVEIDISEMRQLQPLLISCLNEERISDSMFKVLGEVVYHVAQEMLCYQDDTWFDLWNYITSKCKTEFEKAAYIFQCLTTMLDDKIFVVLQVDNLLPEISRRLDPPIELLVDNSCWVLAFAGAFSAVLHLIELSGYVESVKEITYKMIGSVRELVEKGMEVGLVRRAFRDLESIVKKQCKWYSASEYRFVKGLLWRLYEIKGMKMESKIVLWRINVIVERGVNESFKEITKS